MTGIHDTARILLFSAVAILATVLVSQYGFGLAPCQLCIYQRVPYGVVIALALVTLAARLGNRAGAWLILLCAACFLAGGAVALFHVGVEQHWWAGPAACSTQGTAGTAQSVDDLLAQISKPVKIPACDQIAWSLFGVSMAGYNLLASIALAGFSLVAAKRGLGAH